jgi:DNA modification methylase
MRTEPQQLTLGSSIRLNGEQGLSVGSYLQSASRSPLVLHGDAAELLAAFPNECVDMCMTSPPYWSQRQYSEDGIGLEESFEEYVAKLSAVFAQVHRVLKPSGSFWLNLGDTYVDKSLLGMPWRVAIHLIDNQGWIMRNDVIWHKVKGAPDNSKDKLRNIHEHVFHFVKQRRGYYYDANAIRSTPKTAKVKKGAIVSATGVTGVRYRRQIELSEDLSPKEKESAMAALEAMLGEVAGGKIADFRMVIRGRQRATHSDSARVSGRARELQEKGYYFLKYHPDGAKPSDVWEIIPEDTQKREGHFAPYPLDLCRIPIEATCPRDGVVLDPFCGTGTTLLVAGQTGRKSIGIDVAADYVDIARTRGAELLSAPAGAAAASPAARRE